MAWCGCEVIVQWGSGSLLSSFSLQLQKCAPTIVEWATEDADEAQSVAQAIEAGKLLPEYADTDEYAVVVQQEMIQVHGYHACVVSMCEEQIKVQVYM